MSALLLVLLGTLLTPVVAHAEAPSLQVELAVVRPLRLVEWMTADGVAIGTGLDGALVVTVTNPGVTPVTVLDLDEHGVVLVPVAGGPPWVTVHPCKCVRDEAEPESARRTLAAGASHRFELADWGCGGGVWQPPPPGDYRLEYRVKPAPAELPPPRRESPAVLVPACRERLRSDAYWVDAVVSNAVVVQLGPPQPVAVPE